MAKPRSSRGQIISQGQKSSGERGANRDYSEPSFSFNNPKLTAGEKDMILELCKRLQEGEKVYPTLLARYLGRTLTQTFRDSLDKLINELGLIKTAHLPKAKRKIPLGLTKKGFAYVSNLLITEGTVKGKLDEDDYWNYWMKANHITTDSLEYFRKNPIRTHNIRMKVRIIQKPNDKAMEEVYGFYKIPLKHWDKWQKIDDFWTYEITTQNVICHPRQNIISSDSEIAMEKIFLMVDKEIYRLEKEINGFVCADTIEYTKDGREIQRKRCFERYHGLKCKKEARENIEPVLQKSTQHQACILDPIATAILERENGSEIAQEFSDNQITVECSPFKDPISKKKVRLPEMEFKNSQTADRDAMLHRKMVEKIGTKNLLELCRENLDGKIDVLETFRATPRIVENQTSIIELLDAQSKSITILSQRMKAMESSVVETNMKSRRNDCPFPYTKTDKKEAKQWENT